MLEKLTTNSIIAIGLVLALIIGMVSHYDAGTVSTIAGALAGVLTGRAISK